MDVAPLLVELFDGLPNVMFCLKDRDGRYVAVNRAFAERAGHASPAALVGRRAGDVFPAELAASYEAQDAVVLADGRPLRNELELILRPDGSTGWYLTTKVAVLDDDGTPTGIAGVSVDLHAPVEGGPPMAGLAAAVDTARRRYADGVRVDELAQAAGLSVPALERQVRRVFGLSAKQFVLRLRVEAAVRLLATTDISLAEVAATCGYSDQAAFTRQFKRVVGLTPGEYRTRAAGSPPRRRAGGRSS